MIAEIIKLYACIGLGWAFVTALEVYRFIRHGITPDRMSFERKRRAMEFRAGLMQEIHYGAVPVWFGILILVFAVLIRAGWGAIIWPYDAFNFVKGNT